MRRTASPFARRISGRSEADRGAHVWTPPYSDRHDRLADRPQRQSGKLEMRPREREADDGDGQENRGDDVSEREPPAGENQPNEVADHAERAGADIVAAGDGGARHHLLPK